MAVAEYICLNSGYFIYWRKVWIWCVFVLVGFLYYAQLQQSEVFLLPTFDWTIRIICVMLEECYTITNIDQFALIWFSYFGSSLHSFHSYFVVLVYLLKARGWHSLFVLVFCRLWAGKWFIYMQQEIHVLSVCKYILFIFFSLWRWFSFYAFEMYFQNVVWNLH